MKEILNEKMKKMKKSLPLVFILLFNLSYGQQATVNDFGFYEFDNTATGDTLLYRMLKPFNYDSLGSTEYPVFIWMHQNGKQGEDNTNQMNDIWPQYLMDSTMRASFPSFVIAPQCPSDLYWSNFDYNVLYLIDYLKTVEKIDSDRIYVMGWSMGSYACWGFAESSLFPNYFAAAVPIAGSGSPDPNFDPSIYNQTSVWVGHGNLDGIAPVTNARNRIKAIRDAGYDAIYSEFNVPHGSHDETMSEPGIWTWIFSQNRNGGNPPPTPTNLEMNTNGSTATLSWDIPSVSLSVDSIMAYHVYKNGNRITIDISDLADSTGTGLNELLRQNIYVDSNYSIGDSYEVTAVNFRNQESALTTSLDEAPERKVKVVIFPNPAESYIKVNGDFPVNIEYSISTIDGRIVQKGILESQEIDIQKLDTGVYLLQIEGERPMKLIKNN